MDGKAYVSSKRAAQMSQYAQDYIGQLCRKGLIDCRRVNGLWYVTLASLENHKISSADQKAQAFANMGANPESVQNAQNDVILDFSGEEYVSSKHGAEITGYNQDYVTQLARAGKVKSRQVGSRWFVAKKDLLLNKEKNDALLAAVQAKSVGIVRAPGNTINSNENWQPNFRAHEDENHLPLMPDLPPRAPDSEQIPARRSVYPAPIRTPRPIHRPKEEVYGEEQGSDMGKVLDLKSYPGSVGPRKYHKSVLFVQRNMLFGGFSLLFVLAVVFFVFGRGSTERPLVAKGNLETARTAELGAGGLLDTISNFVATKLVYRRAS